MKKIVITLCTLFAVNAGSTMYAPPVPEGKAPERGTTEKAGPERSGTSGRSENAPSTADIANRSKNQSKAKPDAKNGANKASSSSLVTDLGIDLGEVQQKSTKLSESNLKETGSDIISQNLKIITDMNGGAKPEANGKVSPDGYARTITLSDNSSLYTTFDSKGQPTKSTQTQTTFETTGTGRNKRATEITKKIKEIKYNSDGSMTETVFKDNPAYNRETAEEAKNGTSRKGKYTYNVEKTIASHTITYNKDGSVNIARLDSKGSILESKSLTKEEARQGLKKEVADKQSSMTDQQKTQAPAKAEQVRENVKTVQENAPTREEAVNQAAEEASKALENNDEAGVKAAVKRGLESLEGDRVSVDQKATIIDQITAKIMELGKSGKQAFSATIESIRSIINSVLDFTATGQFRTLAPEVDVSETNSPVEDRLFDNGVKKDEYYGDDRPGSPTGVADFESFNELRNEKRVIPTEPKSTVLFR